MMFRLVRVEYLPLAEFDTEHYVEDVYPGFYEDYDLDYSECYPDDKVYNTMEEAFNSVDSVIDFEIDRDNFPSSNIKAVEYYVEEGCWEDGSWKIIKTHRPEVETEVIDASKFRSEHFYNEIVINACDNFTDEEKEYVFSNIIGLKFTTYSILEVYALNEIRETYRCDVFFEYDWKKVMAHMDNEIKRELDAEMPEASRRAYYEAYCEKHEQKYDEEFDFYGK